MSYSVFLSAVCDRGDVRPENQDSIFIQNSSFENGTDYSDGIIYSGSGKLAVFDGMGGEECGEIAAAIARKAFPELLESGSLTLEEICLEINSRICNYMAENGIGRMGATAVMVSVEDKVYFCNIGDSRVYRISDSKITQLSKDHTTIFGKYIKKKYLDQHLGIPEEEMIIEPYTGETEYGSDDVFIMCSDGLTDMVDDETILKISSESDISETAKKLYDEAMAAGGRDNISIIAFRVVK